MSDNNKQSTTLTASEINKEVNEVKEDINVLEDKANKLNELLGMDITFAPWDKKEVVIEQREKIDVDKVLAENEAARKAAEAEQAKIKAQEEAAKKEAEAARKAAEAEEEARKTKEAEEAAKKLAEESKKTVEEPTPAPIVEETPVETVVEVKEEKKVETKPAPTRRTQQQRRPAPKPQQNTQKQSFTGYFEKVVGVKRISKTTKGGRHMRFSALVIIGDKNGIVGYGKGKSIEVPVAIRKALKNAKSNLRKVKINKNGTLYHEVVGKQGAGKVLIKPAPTGTGIIAGGPIRVVLELAGYKDVYSKNLGKNTSINMVLATLNGLSQIRSPKEVAFLRDKQLKEL